jgi:hypothetical protein
MYEPQVGQLLATASTSVTLIVGIITSAGFWASCDRSLSRLWHDSCLSDDQRTIVGGVET